MIKSITVNIEVDNAKDNDCCTDKGSYSIAQTKCGKEKVAEEKQKTIFFSITYDNN